MPEDKIENLQEVLKEKIGDRKVTDVRISRLTAPGENYGSIVLKLDVTLLNEKYNSEEEIHAIAKQLPENEYTRKAFNVQVTFTKEIAMYTTVIPTLQEFQKKHGVEEVMDCYPKFYGARINLDGKSDSVDGNTVIILENLAESGYSTVDRYEGFNLETAQLILKDLAAFHAVPLALKLKKPEIFYEKVRPHLTTFSHPPLAKNEETKESSSAILVEMLQESSKCMPYIPKIEEAFKRWEDTSPKNAREPFATIAHCDFWVTNTMIKFENGKPVKNKLLDFQLCDYKSPASDVFFFLFANVQTSVLEEHLDELIKLYHSCFVSHLEKLNCDTEPFSYDNFLEELRLDASTEVIHALILIVFVILGKKGGISPDALDPCKRVDFDKMRRDIRADAKEKAQAMVYMCGNKGWL